MLCRRLFIPDNEGLVAAVGGALALLGEDENWEQAGTMLPVEAAQLMRDMLARWYDDTGCPEPLPDESSCIDYPPTAPFLSYSPQDPFQQPDFVPAGYGIPPWYHNPLIPLPGVLPGDAMVNFLALPIMANIVDILASGFPRVRINFTGEGQLLIELVRVPQGGLALITIDGAVTGGSLLDLSAASIFDPAIFETIFDIVIDGVNDNVTLHEVEISGAGAHFVDVTFLPVVDNVSILGFGGGVRSVRLCGFDAVGETPMPQFRIEGEILQWRPNEFAGWSDLGDVVGSDGADGATGATGETGATGTTGADGLPGAPGEDGECPDCPPVDDVATAERCNVAFGVAAFWIDHLQTMFGRMIIDSATLDVGDPATFDASVAAYGMTPTGSELRDVLIDIANAWDGITPATFDDYMAQYNSQLETWQVSVQCALFALMPSGAYLTAAVMIDWMNAVEALPSADALVWFRVAEIGRRTSSSSFGALVNEARAFGGDYDCDVCAEDGVWCRTWDLLVESGAGDGWGTAPGFDGYGTWFVDNGWFGTPEPGLVMALPFASPVELTSVEIRGRELGSSGFFLDVYYRMSGSTILLDHASISSEADGFYTATSTTTQTVDEIWVNPVGGTSSEQYMLAATLRGMDTAPEIGTPC